jgi:hypothetical protein
VRAHLKRLFAVAGLALLFPIGLQLTLGQVSPADAAVRAGILFGGVMLARALARLAPSGAMRARPVQD